jgi:itaconyl-CoA hydratase/mesaconyl-C4 CoA hydratase
MAAWDPASWIGRTESCADNIDTGHIERVALSLGDDVPAPGEPLPCLWHWALFVKAQPYASLGEDGHPRRGGFMPPADNRNRMWAGGRLKFVRPLLIGVPGERVSTIADVAEKEGRTGKLLFAVVRHDIYQDGLLCVTEEQDIVYREPAAPRLAGTQAAPASEWSDTIEPSSVMLFRYSSVTFNGHRIHYDETYARQNEGYPGLVVHGPLIATLMCRAFMHANRGKSVTSFSYRGLRPLIAPRPFQVAGRIDSQGSASLWAEQDGTLAHQAQIQFDG